MSKYVIDTAAAKSLRTVVIMKGKRHVATIRAHFGQSRVLVNVFQDTAGQLASGKARKIAESTDPDLNPLFAKQCHDRFQFQYATAGGHGYDKYTAALSGLIIDGHELSDHCDKRINPPKGKTVFPAGFKPPRGYSMANYQSAREATAESPARDGGYMSCYRHEGTRYLESIGYTVIQIG